MNDSERSDLARLLPAPTARDLPAGRQRILKEQMMTELRQEQQTRPPRRRDRRRGRHPVLTVVTVAGALAAVGVLITTVLVPGAQSPGAQSPGAQSPGAQSPGAQSPGAQPTGRDRPAIVLLDKIANAAGRQPAQRVSDSEFMYIRSEVAYPVDTISNGHETSVMERPHERQVWLPVADSCVAGLLIEDGSSTPLGGPPPSTAPGRTRRGMASPTGCGEGNLGGPTYRLLQSLPTSPRALLDLIYTQTKGEGPSPDAEAFTTIGDLIREAIVPPRTAAALYRAAALIPGVMFINHLADAVGRSGVAVAWRTDATDVDAWIFDPVTLQYLGERDYNTVTGTVNGESAVLQRAFVHRTGELP